MISREKITETTERIVTNAKPEKIVLSVRMRAARRETTAIWVS